MELTQRILRHARLIRQSHQPPPSPPFLVLFVNSLCNMKCDHCFYWRNLNQRDDLSKDEIFALSRSLGPVDHLSLSGGEPFLRREIGEICRQFVRQNGVTQIYVPSNGWYTEKTIEQLGIALQEPDLRLFAVELSLDGTAAFHDRFRGIPGAFDRAMRTYDALAELQRRDPRLRIHANSTATNVNIDEIRRLTTFLFERCPQMDHHNLAIIRGDRKDPSLLAPDSAAYRDLFVYIRRLWRPREEGRYGGIVEPMLQWAKLETMSRKTQVVPCSAGKITGVVYANGDVSVCELHEPLGNLRQNSFAEIWWSEAAQRLRASIAAKACHCTTEVFLWPSIVYQPTPLVRAAVGARVWRRPEALRSEERVPTAPPPAVA